MTKSNSSFYNHGNLRRSRPLHRQRLIQTPYQRPFSTRDDSPPKPSDSDDTLEAGMDKKTPVATGKKRPTQKFYINPFRFASLFGQQAPKFQKKLSEMKHFQGPDVIDTQKEPMDIAVDLRTVSLRYDAVREADNDISRFIRCFHHAQSVNQHLIFVQQ